MFRVEGCGSEKGEKMSMGKRERAQIPPQQFQRPCWMMSQDHYESSLPA